MKRIVYLVSPNKINKDFFITLEKVLALKNTKFFQLRLKGVSDEKIIKIAKKIKKITKKYKVKFIINDSPKIAKKINADGCHIGQSDSSILEAKKF